MTEVKYNLGDGEIIAEYDEYGIAKITRECFEALIEKQIPKKPIIKTNLITKHVSAHCSICDTDITYYSSEEKYCHKCGKAIKWGNEDDRAD